MSGVQKRCQLVARDRPHRLDRARCRCAPRRSGRRCRPARDRPAPTARSPWRSRRRGCVPANAQRRQLAARRPRVSTVAELQAGAPGTPRCAAADRCRRRSSPALRSRRRHRAHAMARAGFPSAGLGARSTSARNCPASRRPNGAATPVKRPSRPEAAPAGHRHDGHLRQEPAPSECRGYGAVERRDTEPFAIDPHRDALGRYAQRDIGALARDRQRAAAIDQAPNLDGRPCGRARPSAKANARTSGPASGPTITLRAVSSSSRPSRSSAVVQGRRAFLAEAADLQLRGRRWPARWAGAAIVAKAWVALVSFSLLASSWRVRAPHPNCRTDSGSARVAVT